MRRLLLILCGLTALAGISPAAHAEAAFQKAIWGPIKFPPGQAGCTGPLRCSAFPYYRQLGADVFQYQLAWHQIAPTRPANPGNPNDPAYEWSSELAFAVQEAAASGMRVSFLIKGSPSWANGGRGPNGAPRPGAFAAFAQAAARKFGGVRLWQIWGEPTRKNNFVPQGRKGARRYAGILDAAYRALNRVNRRNIVIGGMTFHGGYTRTPRWIKLLRLKSGKRPRMDWWGHNPFERRFPKLKKKPIGSFRGLSDVDTLWKEIRRAYRGQRKRGPSKLWLSEWTVQSDHTSYVFPFAVSRREQAKWLRAGYRLARRARAVKGMGWYQLTDYPPAPRNPTWGLMTYSGTKKPAYHAYRALP